MAKLERKLGLAGVTAIGLGAMLGSGIFILPGLAAAKTGSGLWLAYLMAALCALPAALSTAEIATAIPATGGKYIFLDRTFGPFWGTISGLGLWLSLLFKTAFALAGTGVYLEIFFPQLPPKWVALTILVAITALNIVGIKKVGAFQIAIVSLSIASLLGLALWSFPHVEPANFKDPFPNGSWGFITAVSLVFVSYYGVTKAAAVAGEVSDPDRNLPWGILLSLALAASLYTAVSYALIGTQPLEKLRGDVHPIYSLAQFLGGQPLGIAAVALAVLMMTSMANTGLLASSRFPFAMSRDNLLPEFLKKVHRKFLTPIYAIVLTSGTIAFSILFLQIEQLAKFASSFLIVIFMAVNVSLLILRFSKPPWYKPSFRSPLFPAIQFLGIALSVLLLYSMGWIGLVSLLGMTVPGALLYSLYGRKFADRSGLLRRLSPRLERPFTTKSDGDPGFYTAPPPDRKAAVIIALLGNERSPEALIEIGASLADGRTVGVLFLTEVPEQTPLEALKLAESKVSSLRRRILAMAETLSLDIFFEPVITHDVSHTVYTASQMWDTECIVLAWRGRRALDPMNWLYRHTTCNLALFNDAGIRYIREILIATEPGPHDSLTIFVADHLAKLWNAKLTFFSFRADPNSPETIPPQDYIQEMRKLCSAPTALLETSGKNPAQALAEVTDSFDLLIIPAPPEYATWKLNKRRKYHDIVNKNASCSVLTLQTPRVQTHLAFKDSEIRDKTALIDPLLFLKPERIKLRHQVKTKEELFRHLGLLLSSSLPEVSPQEIEASLWQRESEQNTAVGNGIAFPHATIAKAEKTAMAAMTLKHPVDYHSPGEEKVDLIFAIAGPPKDRHIHLSLLSKIAQIGLLPEIAQQLREAETSAQFLEALYRCKSKLGEERRSSPAEEGREKIK